MERADESLEGLILLTVVLGEWRRECESKMEEVVLWKCIPHPWALSLVLPLFVPHHGGVPTQGSAAKSSVHLHGGQATTDTTLRSHEQNKPFFFLSCLCQVFAYSGTKATNKIFFISLEFCLDIQIRNWFWKGKDLHNRNCWIHVCEWVLMVKEKNVLSFKMRKMW